MDHALYILAAGERCRRPVRRGALRDSSLGSRRA